MNAAIQPGRTASTAEVQTTVDHDVLPADEVEVLVPAGAKLSVAANQSVAFGEKSHV